ncbi:uncharacterized protein LOC120786003 isoform X2 [Xiphias gladius]|uniref:uncharacterized protein LOC120786003 isoform X2 n=1 Tax=Xiphias gladius TaxID=8245 RepID=UPI001A98D693|nr:uncharacterized protein LOC120786003 isoform X2 [Xiphias gladius]
MEMCSRNYCPSAGQPFDTSDFPHCNGQRGAEYLALVSSFVSKHRHKRMTLKNPADSTFIVGDLEDTIYRGEVDEVNGWGKFYLPNIVNMQVVGVVEGTSCPCDQLVLMTCEDKKLYAYDGEELHLVASSLEQLRYKEIEYPASKSYYNGEAFKDMTKEDWAKVRNGKAGKRLDKEHHELVISIKSSFLENLKISRQRAGIIS